MQGKVWKMLVDLELEHSNLDGAVEIFGKSLLQCYNVTLWMSYMAFIKKVHPVVPSWGHDMCCDRNCLFGQFPHNQFLSLVAFQCCMVMCCFFVTVHYPVALNRCGM